MDMGEQRAWIDNDVKTHIKEYVGLVALGKTDQANEYFTNHLFAPFDCLAGAVYAKTKGRYLLGELDDFKQAAMVNVLRCIPLFDPTQPVKAMTYFYTIVLNKARELNASNRRIGERLHCVPLDSEVERIPAPETGIPDLRTKHQFFVRYWTPERLSLHFTNQGKRVAEHVVSLVVTGEGNGIDDNFAKGFNGATIANQLGCSHQTVCNATQKLTQLTTQAWVKQE